VCLYVLKERENAHISIYVHKNRIATKEKNKIFPLAVNLNVLEMKLDLYAHEKKMKQPNGRLFIGNNNNKDRKKRKTSLCIYCKKIIRQKNNRTWFSLNPY